jgi:flagellar hook assembly protein FlgD
MKKILKTLFALLTAIMLAVPGAALSAIAADALTITYIGQPDDPAHQRYSYACVIRFGINGYGGNKLNVEIADEDGDLLLAEKSPYIKTNRATWDFYWDGKTMDGLRYDDGVYVISYWIEGRRDDTFTTRRYDLDLKGNSLEDNTSRTFMRLVYIGTPDRQASPYFNYAFNVRVRYKNYKGETAKIRIYDPSGRHVSTGTAYIDSNDFTYDYYWDGYDKNGVFCRDGKYTVTYYIDGIGNYTNDSMVVALRKPVKFVCKIAKIFNTGDRSKGVMGFTVNVSGYNNETLRAEITDAVTGRVYKTFSYKIKTSKTANYTWYWDGKLYDGRMATGGCVVSVWIENYYAGTYTTEEIADVAGDWDEEFPDNPEPV